MVSSNNLTSLNNFDIPRNISIGLKLKIFFNYPLAAIGIVFFLFGSIFVLVFGSVADFKSLSFHDNDPMVKGVIFAIKGTNNKENKRNVYDYTYGYTINGRSYLQHSFSTSSAYKDRDTVTVQYLVADPGSSRIHNMRSAPFSIWVVPLTCIFPVIGLLFLSGAIRRAKKNIYLVKNGILTKGKVIRKEPTNTRINKQTVYKVFFQFKTPDGNMQEAFVNSHMIYNLGDEAEEPLVYDSQNPSDAVLLDSLPKKIRPLLTGL